MKRSTILAFVGGTLTIKLDGHDGANGWGQFAFDEGQTEQVPYEEREGSSIIFDIPKSELLELRDFIDKTFKMLEGT